MFPAVQVERLESVAEDTERRSAKERPGGDGILRVDGLGFRALGFRV